MSTTEYKRIAIHKPVAEDFKILSAKIERDFDEVRGFSGSLSFLMDFFKNGGR